MLHNIPIRFFRDRVDFTRLRLVHHIEQRRKRVAETKTAPATMANIKNPLKFSVQRYLVAKIRVPPVNGMTNRCLKAPLAGGRLRVGHLELTPC